MGEEKSSKSSKTSKHKKRSHAEKTAPEENGGDAFKRCVSVHVCVSQTNEATKVHVLTASHR